MLLVPVQVQAIEPLFSAVYGPDVVVDLRGPDADYEVINVLKQAHFLLSTADTSERALATALATLCICDDAANVSVDTSQVSEALEEPVLALVEAWQSVWGQLRDMEEARDIALRALEEEQSKRNKLQQENEERCTRESAVTVLPVTPPMSPVGQHPDSWEPLVHSEASGKTQ
jgi:hypothetical protein